MPLPGIMTEQSPNPEMKKYAEPKNWAEADEDYQASKAEAADLAEPEEEAN